MSSLNIVLAIIAIGSLFGVAQQFGILVVKHIFERFSRSGRIRIKRYDGSYEIINLTQEEANGFYRVWNKLNLDNTLEDEQSIEPSNKPEIGIQTLKQGI